MLPDVGGWRGRARPTLCLNAPTGAWCSLTEEVSVIYLRHEESQCTYRCVVLPDIVNIIILSFAIVVSMHLQVRGAP